MGPQILFIFMMIALVRGNCPTEKMKRFGHCSYHIECSRCIQGVQLQNICNSSYSWNHHANIEVILNDVDNSYNYSRFDKDFFKHITSMRVHSPNVSESSFEFMFDYMVRLQKLILADNGIQYLEVSPFYNLYSLEILDLSHNQFSNVDDMFEFEMHPNKLENLSLAYNDIETINNVTFASLTALKELDLSHNYITDLTQDPFKRLTSLNILKLNGNRIKDLNGAFNDLNNLKHLYLIGNQINTISAESLMIIYDLETFDISSNKLENIQPSILMRHWHQFGYDIAWKIRLANNSITHLLNASSYDHFTRYTRSSNVDVITELDLSINSISTIEYNAFQTIHRLVYLDLSHNNLINFVVNPEDLVHVKSLNLSHNYITALNFDSFWSMEKLQNLDLSHNHLENIPGQAFTHNQDLVYVNMTENFINRVEHLKLKMFHPEGGVLDLSKNNISFMNIYEGSMRLNMLVLHSNHISDPSLIRIDNHNELHEIDLSRNDIKELDKLSLQLPNVLLTLDLSLNMIDTIGPATFNRISHLKTLRLSHNNLTKVDYGIFQGLGSLQKLDLSYNAISFLDSQVLLELKSLKDLSLRFNGLQVLDYKGWLVHHTVVNVYLEGNSLTCDWLGTALTDFNKNYSKMKPVVVAPSVTGRSIGGIPCIDNEVGHLKSTFGSVTSDERLLVIAHKILEAVKEQNHFMKRYLWNATMNMQEIAEQAIKMKLDSK